MSVDGNITCYSYTADIEYPHNTKCPNSDSCCSTAAQCRPDRLCVADNEPNVLLRPSCTQHSWLLQTCAQICLYSRYSEINFSLTCPLALTNPIDTATKALPRVNICPDGSYCCDNQPNCCLDKTGVFLDNNGVAIGYANRLSSPTTLTPTTSTSASTSLFSSSSALTDSSSPPSNNVDNLLALKIGIPLGVIFALCLGIGIFRYFWQHKKQARAEIYKVCEENNMPGPITSNVEVAVHPLEMSAYPGRLPVGMESSTWAQSGQRPRSLTISMYTPSIISQTL